MIRQGKSIESFIHSFIPLLIGRFCVALFSASEQPHCALVVCDSKSVTDAKLHSASMNTHRSGLLIAVISSLNQTQIAVHFNS